LLLVLGPVHFRNPDRSDNLDHLSAIWIILLVRIISENPD
jgi:hypothetical protein